MKTLAPVLSLAALSTLLVQSADAAILAEEAFDYGPGFLQNRTGGTGFGGPWSGRPSFFAEDAQQSFPSDAAFSYPGLTRTLGAVTMSRANYRASDRKLDTAAGGAFDGFLDANGNIGADGTELWIGFIATDDNASTGGGDARLRLHRDVPASEPRPRDADQAFELCSHGRYRCH